MRLYETDHITFTLGMPISPLLRFVRVFRERMLEDTLSDTFPQQRDFCLSATSGETNWPLHWCYPPFLPRLPSPVN